MQKIRLALAKQRQLEGGALRGEARERLQFFRDPRQPRQHGGDVCVRHRSPYLRAFSTMLTEVMPIPRLREIAVIKRSER